MNQTKGSYDCQCLNGYEDKSGGTGKICEDIDECAAGTDDCATVRPGATCINKEPGYECGCRNGYEESPTGCIDIDECETDAKGQCTATLCNNCLNQVFKILLINFWVEIQLFEIKIHPSAYETRLRGFISKPINQLECLRSV